MVDKPTSALQKCTLKTTDRKGSADGSGFGGVEDRSRRTTGYGIYILEEEDWICGQGGRRSSNKIFPDVVCT